MRSTNSSISRTLTKDVPAFRRALLRWYDANHRDLPWRASHDPYRIWLSEIMLQQTRVAAVLDHYRIFLERFPNVEALAAAAEDKVLAAWSGLGYYRRARMLHQCAKELAQKHGGRFPRTADELQALPGIGRYTAAAIASIAFAQPIAVVDGNVERVLQRLTGVTLNDAQTWEHAQALLAASRPGDSNQAMMELGATVCIPREPLCLVCPVRTWCTTRGASPRSAQSPRQEKKEIWCVLESRNARAKEKVRLVQRPKTDSLMPGMWELPQSSAPPASNSSAPWRTFRHSITVTDYTVHVLRRALSAADRRAPNSKWFAVDQIAHTPISGLTRKILRAGGII